MKLWSSFIFVLFLSFSSIAQIADEDGDYIPDDVDNCLGCWNFSQSDADGDGLGDCWRCDWCYGPGTDTDWDGVCDGEDNCPYSWNVDQRDSDADGVGDACPEYIPPDNLDAGLSVEDAGHIADSGANDSGTIVNSGVDAGTNGDSGTTDEEICTLEVVTCQTDVECSFGTTCVNGNCVETRSVCITITSTDGGLSYAPPAFSNECIDSGYTRYPSNTVHSPITCGVANNIVAILANNPNTNDLSFMKVGDSISYFEDNMGCFVGTQERPFTLEETGHGYLTNVRELFSATKVSGTTPFDRTSSATRASQVAAWATAGNPSPIMIEHSVMNPSFAFVMFGANDIGRTMDTRLIGETTEWYATNMMAIADEIISLGTVPIFVTLPPLGPSGGPSWMQELALNFAQVTRGIAEMYQVPFVNLQDTLLTLNHLGLRDDDTHLNEMRFDNRCNFTPEGLQYGTNNRNLFALEALDRVYELTASPGRFWDASGLPTLDVNQGSYVVDSIPFVHSGNGDAAYSFSLNSAKGLRIQVFGNASMEFNEEPTDSNNMYQGAVNSGNNVVAVNAVGKYLLVIQECNDQACFQ